MANLESTFDAVSFRYILLDYYKKLHIDETELVVILMCDHLIRQGNKFITADLLRLKMSMHTAELDKILVSLMGKKMIDLVPSDDGMVTSLEPLKAKLCKLFENDLAKDRANLLSSDRCELKNKLIAYFGKRLNRKISPIEVEMITTWMDDDYDERQIVDALELALSQNKKTFRSIDHRIRQARAKDDFSKEGYTAMGDRWGKDIEKTIEIAKTKWVDDDSEK